MKRILITLAIIIVYIAMLVVYSEVHSEDFYLRSKPNHSGEQHDHR